MKLQKRNPSSDQPIEYPKGNIVYEKHIPPYRVGKKQKRAILDSQGLEVVVFPKGSEDMASEYCFFLNNLKRVLP